MALPPFGFYVHEKAAGLLMLLTGLLSLTLLIATPGVLLGQGLLQPTRTWLILQSLVVILGALGAFAGIFTAVALGAISGLLPTSAAYLTFLPSLAVLIFASLRRRAFVEFGPDWPDSLLRPPHS
jgi:hypothetical protein